MNKNDVSSQPGSSKQCEYCLSYDRTSYNSKFNVTVCNRCQPYAECMARKRAASTTGVNPEDYAKRACYSTTAGK
ncbi:hypothetical protein CHUAL_006925 [Chamberlinius hualienensis]